MEFALLNQEGFVTTLTVNHPKALNALSSKVLADLNEAIDSIDLSTCRCLIITGAGEKAFVAGADIKEMLNLNAEEAKQFGLLGSKVFRKIESLPIPVIAAVNGFCLGGGMELAMSCDIRLASENAVFGQPEVGLGITPGFCGTQRLPKLVGLAKANELILTAKKIKAAEAEKIGLVNHVYPLENLMEEAVKMANVIAGNAPVAVRASKEAMQMAMRTDIDAGIMNESNLFAHCFTTEDRVNAMQAFVDKTPAKPFENK